MTQKDTQDTQHSDEGIVDPDREFEATEAVIISDGEHSGIVSKVVYRTTPFEYTDVYINTIDEKETGELKVGFPSNISDVSILGITLQKFGANIAKGQKVNPYKILVGKKCKFTTIAESYTKKDGKKATAPRIVRETFRPI